MRPETMTKPLSLEQERNVMDDESSIRKAVKKVMRNFHTQRAIKKFDDSARL